jgi:hypothetical protein
MDTNADVRWISIPVSFHSIQPLHGIVGIAEAVSTVASAGLFVNIATNVNEVIRNTLN